MLVLAEFVSSVPYQSWAC